MTGHCCPIGIWTIQRSLKTLKTLKYLLKSSLFEIFREIWRLSEIWISPIQMICPRCDRHRLAHFPSLYLPHHIITGRKLSKVWRNTVGHIWEIQLAIFEKYCTRRNDPFISPTHHNRKKIIKSLKSFLKILFSSSSHNILPHRWSNINFLFCLKTQNTSDRLVILRSPLFDTSFIRKRIDQMSINNVTTQLLFVTRQIHVDNNLIFQGHFCCSLAPSL